MTRKAYPSDYEWAFVAPYLTLMREDAFNVSRWQSGLFGRATSSAISGSLPINGVGCDGRLCLAREMG